MQFTDAEKLIITMLCEIHERLNIEDGVDPTFVRDALFSGDSWALKWQYPGIFDTVETDESVVKEVVEIIDMWMMLEVSHQRMSEEDKVRVEKEAEPFGRSVKFRGFDGNNESQHMGVAEVLVNKMERFTEFKGRNFNSHMPTLHSNRQMLEMYTPIRDTNAGDDLNVDQIVTILKAAM